MQIQNSDKNLELKKSIRKDKDQKKLLNLKFNKIFKELKSLKKKMMKKLEKKN
jgi:DNA-directed RNA polymerase subunit L